MAKHNHSQHIKEALHVIKAIGLPKGQQNDRSALCLLALLNLNQDKVWHEAEKPLMGITPIMNWVREHYGKEYAPNSRETFRRFTLHQFVEAGIALYNPDEPNRPTNSPHAVYQIDSHVLELLQSFESENWNENLADYLSSRSTLATQYAKERQQNQIPVIISAKKEIHLSPGKHSELIRDIIEQFAPRFIPGATLVYIGDTGRKWAYFDEVLAGKLGLTIDSHGKIPDVILYCEKRNWIILIESVTSHGPVDSKRHSELAELFTSLKPGLVYVTAFPSRQLMSSYLGDIAWETEVWVADSPSHLIHFNGERFLGPY